MLKTNDGMKVSIIKIFLVISLIGCSNPPDVKDVVISRVNYTIETPVRIDCNKFNTSFSPELISKRTISDAEVDQFLEEIQDLEKMEEGWGVDVRAKILINYGNRKDTICANNYFLKIAGQTFKITDRIKSIIWLEDAK
jgi:hypothetical protein